MLDKHIVLMGFKHVGKSIIGKSLADKVGMPFIDLDHEVELGYQKKFNTSFTCRQIMENHGEIYFRRFEAIILADVIQASSAVMALGGGTPLNEENQNIIANHILVHIKAPQDRVFARILKYGSSSFIESFNQLWDERNKIYEKIAHFSLMNDSTVYAAVCKIIEALIL